MMRRAIGAIACALLGVFQAMPTRAEQPVRSERPDTSPRERAWGRGREAAARTMVRMLDMTSFPNSIGPRWVAGKRTLADYGFTVVHSFDDGWVDATLPDGSWRIGIFVLTNGRRHKRLCVTDAAIGGGTYDSVGAIDAHAQGDGFWRAVRVIGSVAGCSGR